VSVGRVTPCCPVGVCCWELELWLERPHRIDSVVFVGALAALLNLSMQQPLEPNTSSPLAPHDRVITGMITLGRRGPEPASASLSANEGLMRHYEGLHHVTTTESEGPLAGRQPEGLPEGMGRGITNCQWKGKA
jgi:hypothetical protein